MKKTLVLSALLALSITAGAQEFFQDSKNPELLRPCGYQADHGKETVLPVMSSIRLSVGKGDSTLIVSCDNRAEKEIFVDNLLKQMTLREKLGQMTQVIPETGVITGPEGTPMNIEAQIKAGEVADIEFVLTPEDMSFCRKDMKFAQESGDFTVWVGNSSDATLEGKFTVK